MRNVHIILHEFDHVAGLNHAPREAGGVMGFLCPYCDDFSEAEWFSTR